MKKQKALGLLAIFLLTSGQSLWADNPPQNIAPTSSAVPAWAPNASYRASENNDGQSERDELGESRYIIPETQLRSRFLKGFSVEIMRRDGSSHVKLNGFLPRKCSRNLRVSGPTWNSARQSYDIMIEGVASNSESNWRQCFEEWTSAPRNRSCRRDETDPEWRCVSLSESEVVGLNVLQQTPLTQTGKISLRTESPEVDGSPSFHDLGVDFLSDADLLAREQREQFITLCNAARTGNADDITALRDFGVNADLPRAVEIANAFEQDLRHREEQQTKDELEQLIAREISTVAEARTKIQDLVQARRRRGISQEDKTKIGEALMAIVEQVKRFELPENGREVNFNISRYDVIESALREASRMGVRGAAAARAQNSIDRYAYAVREPNVDASTYYSARQSAERSIRDAYGKAQRERGADRPYASVVRNGMSILNNGHYTAQIVRYQNNVRRAQEEYGNMYRSLWDNHMSGSTMGLGSNW